MAVYNLNRDMNTVEEFEIMLKNYLLRAENALNFNIN